MTTAALPLVVYLAGVLIGLTVMRDRWPVRLVTALAWPLGPLAFVVVIAMLTMTVAVLWPLPVIGAAAAAAATWWMLIGSHGGS